MRQCTKASRPNGKLARDIFPVGNLQKIQAAVNTLCVTNGGNTSKHWPSLKPTQLTATLTTFVVLVTTPPVVRFGLALLTPVLLPGFRASLFQILLLFLLLLTLLTRLFEF